jgi:RNA-directed DNA polymerase
VSPPSPQRYLSNGRRQGIDEDILTHAVAAIRRIRKSDPRLTPVLTLRHLSALSGTPYFYLRHTVTRNLGDQYKFVYLKKRIPGRNALRMICIPKRPLMQVQRWITQHILRFTTPHEASFAFHPDCRPIDAVEQHLSCEWLLKVDLQDFFHSITERDVCRIFSELGYARLLSFEMARLVTIAVDRKRPISSAETRWTAIPSYQSTAEGM